MMTGREWGRWYKVATKYNIGTDSSDLLAAVLGWNTTTQYWACYKVTETGSEEEENTVISSWQSMLVSYYPAKILVIAEEKESVSDKVPLSIKYQINTLY